MPDTIKVEAVTVAGRPMYCVTFADGRIRTQPALQTLALLNEAMQAEHTRGLRLLRELDDAQAQIETCVAAGKDAANARADAARLQTEAADATAQVAHIGRLADQIRESVIAAKAESLRRQHQAANDEFAATLPIIPLGETP